MARTIRVTAVHIYDDNGVGPVRCAIEAEITDDDPVAIALGASKKLDTRVGGMPRPAWNALLNAIQRPKSDDFPDAMLAHPIAKVP